MYNTLRKHAQPRTPLHFRTRSFIGRCVRRRVRVRSTSLLVSGIEKCRVGCRGFVDLHLPHGAGWLDLQQQAEKGGMACVSLGICFHRHAGLAHIARTSTCPPPLRQDLPSLPPPHLHPLRLAADLPHLTTTTTHMLVNSWPHGVMPSP